MRHSLPSSNILGKGLLALMLSVVTACGTASQYHQECALRHEDYSQRFACVKDKLYNDPRSRPDADTTDTSILLTYGEQLNSLLRQHRISNEQANDLFAKKSPHSKRRARRQRLQSRRCCNRIGVFRSTLGNGAGLNYPTGEFVCG